jgi:hypothetical protein
MSSKLVQFLKSGPPPARIALLPDHRFFVRTVPVAAGTDPTAVPAQIELALEGLSPFPPAQLYYGYHWVAGSPHALVFGCYRKRFTTDQHAAWSDAVLVAPAFAAFLAVPHEPATTLVFPSAEGLTAIHWADGAVPDRVVSAPVPAEADEAARTKIHDDLLRAAGPTVKVIDVSAPPVPAASPDEKHYTFSAGTFVCSLPVAVAHSLDVRDRDELTAWRKKVRNDLWLWRAAAGSVAALILLGVLQVGILTLGARWDASLAARYSQQRPVVQEIQAKEALAKGVEERDSKLLLPLEMVSAISALPQRGSIVFTKSVANLTESPYVVTLTCQTPNSPEVELFLAALKSLPSVEDAKVSNNTTRGGQTSFTLSVTFKADGLKPSAAPTVATKSS